MENKIQTTIVYWDYIGGYVVDKYRGHYGDTRIETMAHMVLSSGSDLTHKLINGCLS